MATSAKRTPHLDVGKELPAATTPRRPPRSRATAPSEFKSSMLNIRVKDQLKTDAAEILAEIGISLPEAVRVFLNRVVRDRAFPFRLELPNTETEAALRASRETAHRRFATAGDLFDDLQKGGDR